MDQNVLNSPLQIGPLQLNSRLIQGPLAGISCASFRELFSLFTPPAYSVSEMISAKDLVSKGPQANRYLYRSPLEKTLCYQLSGNEPATLAKACRIVEDLGADLIDLNAGCPKPKIRKKNAGSKLLESPDDLAKILESMRSATKLPLTLKIRVDGLSNDRNHKRVAKVAESCGVDALIVHARHWQDDYDTACHYHQVAEIVQNIDIPVIVNGDVRCHHSLKNALHLTGAQAAMISRAGSGKPWLYQQLLQDNQLKFPPFKQQQQFYLDHLESLSRLVGETLAVLQGRHLAKYYFPEQPEVITFCQSQDSLDDLKALVTNVKTLNVK